MKRAGFAEILLRLADHEVQFVVVGMTAGVLQGAPVTTIDLGIVYSSNPENVGRLLRALRELDAVYRHDPSGLRPTESDLLGDGHQLLRTKHGDLDCLGAIDEGRGYDDLLPHTVEMSLDDGKHIKVLDLPGLIEAKERAGRPKDLAALPVLRATLDETRRRR
jgi:hypothetical protein